jgi:hypothetical protein
MSSSPKFQREMLELLRKRYSKDLVSFVRDMFDWKEMGYKEPHEWQRTALDAIGKRGKQLFQYAVVGGNGVGKTVFLSWMIIWMLSTHDRCYIAYTSSNQRRLKESLWREVGLWLQCFKVPGLIKRRGQSAWNAWVPGGMERCRAHSFLWGDQRTGHHQSRLGGQHAPNFLLIFDEAGTIVGPVWKHAFTMLATGRSIWLACGNPTQGSAFHAQVVSGDWKCQHVKPTGLNETYVKIQQSGNENDERRFLHGEFVREMDNDNIPLFSTRCIERAMRGRVVSNPNHSIVLGVDIAGAAQSGDRTAVAVRNGDCVLELVAENMTIPTLMHHIKNLTARYAVDAIFVDSIGIANDFAPRLKEELAGSHATKDIVIMGVAGNSAASQPRKYFNKRAEMYLRFAEWLERPGAVLPRCSRLAEELTLFTCSLGDTRRGRVYKVIDKRSYILALRRSSDSADAIAYTFSQGEYLDRPLVRTQGELPAMAQRCAADYSSPPLFPGFNQVTANG